MAISQVSPEYGAGKKDLEKNNAYFSNSFLLFPILQRLLQNWK
jgi:hypothetical protein